MDSSPLQVAVNGRFMRQPFTGVQRYAWELSRRLPVSQVIAPGPPLPPYAAIGRPVTIRPGLRRLPGHAWEQSVLPRALSRNQLLWSPGGSGPLAVRRQVLTIHDAAHLEHPEWYSRSFSLWYRALLPVLARRVRRVLTVSGYLSELNSFFPLMRTVPGYQNPRLIVVSQNRLSRKQCLCPTRCHQVRQIPQYWLLIRRGTATSDCAHPAPDTASAGYAAQCRAAVSIQSIGLCTAVHTRRFQTDDRLKDIFSRKTAGKDHRYRAGFDNRPGHVPVADGSRDSNITRNRLPGFRSGIPDQGINEKIIRKRSEVFSKTEDVLLNFVSLRQTGPGNRN